MRDLYSTNVEAAAYLAREDPWTPFVDDRPTRAEVAADAEEDRRRERMRQEASER